MPAIPVGTITLYYESHGKGDPLVLLPDLGNDVTSLWAQMPELSQEYRCIALDNRGVGRSSKPSAAYTTKLMAEDAIKVMNHLGIDKAHVFGISMGGAIAQEMAINHPERVDRLAILGGWAKPDRYLTSLFELFRDVKRSVDPLTFDREIALWSFTRSYFDSSYDELEKRQRAALDVPYPTPPVTFTRQAEACMAHDALERLEGLTAPTLLMVGEQDIFTPRRFSDEMAKRIKKARVEVVQDAAHAAYWEKPEEVNALLLKHLAG
ncbi:MAG TPA: alpha/beta hydrolase [Chloroflexota bacterium]|jgi:pimeloyl-ACP methyl ester carboxylesterase|nr:alpha/beta hydrolase [Chloroflexota bacterium]